MVLSVGLVHRAGLVRGAALRPHGQDAVRSAVEDGVLARGRGDAPDATVVACAGRGRLVAAAVSPVHVAQVSAVGAHGSDDVVVAASRVVRRRGRGNLGRRRRRGGRRGDSGGDSRRRRLRECQGC